MSCAPMVEDTSSHLLLTQSRAAGESGSAAAVGGCWVEHPRLCLLLEMLHSGHQLHVAAAQTGTLIRQSDDVVLQLQDVT